MRLINPERFRLLTVVGATVLQSTLAVTGNATFNGDISIAGAFAPATIAASGNGSFGGTLSSVGDFSVNTDKFTVAAASGNTVVAGTLNATGIGTFAAAVNITGKTTLAGHLDLSVAGNNNIKATNAAGALVFLTGGSATARMTISNAGAITIAGATTIQSTTTISSGAPTLYFHETDAAVDNKYWRFVAATERFYFQIGNDALGAFGNVFYIDRTGTTADSIVFSPTSVTVSGVLYVTNNVAVNTNKFTIVAASGNTAVAGTLTVGSTLTVTGATTLSSTCNVVNNFTVNTNKFTVTAASGNTTIAGTLGVTGLSTLAGVASTTGTFSSTLTITGATTCNGGLSVGGGKFNLGADSNLTVASGAITITKPTHTVDTEGSAATDDLDTISGGAEGDIVCLRAYHTDRTVVVKNGTGNIILSGDISLSDTVRSVVLHFDGSNWREFGSTVQQTGALGDTVITGTLDVSDTATLANHLDLSYAGANIIKATDVSGTLAFRTGGAVTDHLTIGSSGAVAVNTTLSIGTSATIASTAGLLFSATGKNLISATHATSSIALRVGGGASDLVLIEDDQISLNLYTRFDNGLGVASGLSTFGATVVCEDDIDIDGHIITSGSLPSCVANTTVLNNGGGSGGAATLTGDDTSGYILLEWGAGGTPITGVVATIEFANNYASAPNILVSNKYMSSSNGYPAIIAANPKSGEETSKWELRILDIGTLGDGYEHAIYYTVIG